MCTTRRVVGGDLPGCKAQQELPMQPGSLTQDRRDYFD
jgi:hypothetical protein